MCVWRVNVKKAGWFLISRSKPISFVPRLTSECSLCFSCNHNSTLVFKKCQSILALSYCWERELASFRNHNKGHLIKKYSHRI